MVCTCLLFILTLSSAVFEVLHSSKVEDVSGMAASSPNTADPLHCMANQKLRMEVLPGSGWDNLDNKEMGPVVQMEYKSCSTTGDNMYLVPDNIYVIPVKDSLLEVYGETIGSWQEYNSMTSSSINAGFDIYFISGSFSSDFEHCKKTQVNEHSSTARVQVRYHMYTLRLVQGIKLHPTFKTRLLAIASNLQSNQTKQAQYIAELLVRDFGTHVITKVDAGAILAQEDYLRRSFFSDSGTDKSQIKGSVGASFMGKIGFDFGGQWSHSESFKKQYETNVTSSKVITHGGRLVTRNFSMEQWEKSVDNALVAIDRDGDPLHYVITPENVPELPPPLLQQVTSLVKKTVDHYYEINTHPGCTTIDSQNFDYKANIDDGSCKTQPNNFTFGGVYQTCRSQSTQAGDMCPDLLQKNPLTGQYACPSEYDAIKLNTGNKRAQSHHNECHQHCSGWWIFKSCHQECGEVYLNSQATYEAYWCVARGKVQQDSGYLFGGVFTSKVANPITRTRSCPSKFYPLRLGSDMKICVSDDYELGFRYSVPFAGLFSCNAGNPLVIHHDLMEAKARMQSKSGNVPQHMPLVMSVGESSPAKYPHRCPPGYSQHLAAIDEGCEINFCVKVNALSYRNLPKLHRPPWSDPYDVQPNATEVMYIIGPAKRIYLLNDSTNEWNKATMGELQTMLLERGDGPTANTMTPGAIAGVAVGVTAFVGLVSIVLFVVIRKRRAEKRQYHYQNANAQRDDTQDAISTQNGASYGTCIGNNDGYSRVSSTDDTLPSAQV